MQHCMEHFNFVMNFFLIRLKEVQLTSVRDLEASFFSCFCGTLTFSFLELSKEKIYLSLSSSLVVHDN